MSDIERYRENQEGPYLMNYEQFESVRTRTYDIIAAQYSGLGLDGDGYKEDDLRWSQLILDDLLHDLKSDQAVSSYEKPDILLTYYNLPEYALIPLSAIVSAPNLDRKQKTQLVTEYPGFLYFNNFTMTLRGARSKVRHKVKEAKFIDSYDRVLRRQLVKDVDRVWHKERRQRAMQYLGFVAEQGYILRDTRLG